MDGHHHIPFPYFLLTMQPDFWKEPKKAVRRAYRITDDMILDKAVDLGKGGSTAVTAILINCQKLVVANVGDSRAVISKNGRAKQLSVDHEPSVEKEHIENRGGFVSNFPGKFDSSKNNCQMIEITLFNTRRKFDLTQEF